MKQFLFDGRNIPVLQKINDLSQRHIQGSQIAYGIENFKLFGTVIAVAGIWRLFVLGDCVWCEYNGAYRGLLEQKLLPSITPKESLLDSEVLDSSLYGHEKKKLREYAEDNLKLKKFRRENFNENRTGVAPFDHPKKVYDEFIKEDYIAPSSKENNK